MSDNDVERLPLRQYANLLCHAVESYDYPAVTYDFGQLDYDSSGPNLPRVWENHHASMREVEQYIGGLLTSSEPEGIKNGISNVLYWGYASQPGRQKYWVWKFRNNVKDCTLKSFAKEVQSLSGPGLVSLKQISVPGFSGMSFVSKLRMFLDPTRYPVLDQNLAKAFSQRDSFSPLQLLTFGKAETSIRITENNQEVYGKWASWCRGIAQQTNQVPPHPNFRAVDVERAVFQLVDQPTEAWRLLRGPRI